MENQNAPESSKKKKRPRRKGNNAAVSNAPKQEASPLSPASSRSAQLLAQLAAAQSGSGVPPPSNAIPPAVLFTSRVPPKRSWPIQKSDNAAPSGLDKTPTRRSKECSVGERMARQPPPPPSSSFRARNRNPSTNVTVQPSLPPRGPKIPADVLDDISFRFLLNLPDSEKWDETRICFQIELAHWFYVDFYVNQQERKDCPNVNLRDFLKYMFIHNDFLKSLSRRADQIVDNWRVYKSTVPTYGAILLDSTLNFVLLVQGYYSNKNSWGFPKGKVNETEGPRACAIREVLEETGFDFGDHSIGNEHRLQKFVNDAMVRLYIVTDVPTDYNFAPKTRCEIRKMQWFNIWDLPTDRSDQVAENKGFPARHFYGVVPFVNDIQSYARKEMSRRETPRKEKKETPLGAGKKNSAFTKVQKRTLEEKRSMLDILMGEVSSSSTTPSTSSQRPNETLFRPLTESTAPPGSHLAQIMAATAAAPLRRNVALTTGVIAHPVPIRGIPSDRPVYEAPKEATVRQIKRVVDNSVPSWNSMVASPSCSASQLEDVLNKMLLTQGPVSTEMECDGLDEGIRGVSESSEGDYEVEGVIQQATSMHLPQPLSVAPMLEALRSTDSSCSIRSRNGKAGFLPLSRHLGYSTHSVDRPPVLPPLSPSDQFQLCDAWNHFTLNREAILAPFHMQLVRPHRN